LISYKFIFIKKKLNSKLVKKNQFDYGSGVAVCLKRVRCVARNAAGLTRGVKYDITARIHHLKRGKFHAIESTSV
jgi:hypothetical protein